MTDSMYPAPAFSREHDEIYPLTVIHSRYQGTYEGGVYLAWNRHFYNINPAAMGDDVECATYFGDSDSHDDGPIGVGRTPNAAIADLRKKLDEATAT